MKQQAQEGPVVAEPHTAAQKAAVVIPAKDADAAGGAMPTAGWHLALALVAVSPALAQTAAGQHHAPDAGVRAQEEPHVAQQVEQLEGGQH